MMQGIGERIGPPLQLPPLFALLVNPRVAVPTPEVFRRLARVPGEVGPSDHPDIRASEGSAALLSAVASGRNDLEPPAIAAEPVIGAALAALRALDGCRLARMSGSGATVFGIFDECRAAARAARALRGAQPGWWVKPTVFR
jgi:4-diphosphocytidyl-2-C-methyl-D-erythritol kinase